MLYAILLSTTFFYNKTSYIFHIKVYCLVLSKKRNRSCPVFHYLKTVVNVYILFMCQYSDCVHLHTSVHLAARCSLQDGSVRDNDWTVSVSRDAR